jgi:hypothetical protein
MIVFVKSNTTMTNNNKIENVNEIVQSLKGIGYFTNDTKVSFKKQKYCGGKAKDTKEVVIYGPEMEYVLSINVWRDGMINCHLWRKENAEANENFRHTYGAWNYVGKTAIISVNEIVRMIDRTLRTNWNAFDSIVAR